MEMLREVSRYVHIIFGFGGLAAFWVPVLTRKGKATHRRWGKIFSYCVYAVAGTAIFGVLVELGRALASGARPGDSPGDFGFAVLLFYLAIITLASVRHALAAVRTKGEPARADTIEHRALAVLSFAGSALVAGYALLLWSSISIVLLALSPIGAIIGTGMRRYVSNPPASRMSWWYEHMGAMFGAGIAFHTAFAVFGFSRLTGYALSGAVALIPWVLPAVVGTIATSVWTRHYRRKFGEAGPRRSTGRSVPAA